MRGPVIKSLHKLFACLVLLAASSQTLIAKDQKLQQLSGEIKQLKSQIRLDKKTRNAIVSELARTEVRIGKLGKHVHRLQRKIKQLDSSLTAQDRNLAKQQKMLVEAKRQLSALMRSAYMNGKQERIKLFLNQQDPVQLNRIMTYYEYFNRQRIEHIATARQLINDINQTREQIALNRQALDASYREKNEQLASMQQAMQQRNRLLAKINSDIDAKSQSLEQLKLDAENLKKLLADIRKKQQHQQSQKFSKMKKKLPWPTPGYLSKLYGSDKVGGVKWDGVLITAPEGRNVAAIHHGKVAYADWLRGYGLLLIIDHGEGYMTLYGHNQSLFKETGDTVEAGEVIALVGNSGGQKNPGLYFSLRNKGKPKNPKVWCKKIKGRTIKVQ